MSCGVGKNDRVHETAQQIDTSKEDSHDGDKFWDGSIHGVSVRHLELADTEGLADDLFEGLGFIEEGDFDAKKENWNIAGWERGEADGIFFGGDEGESASGAGSGEGVFDLGSHEAMVIGKGALVDDFGAQFDQAFEKTFRDGNSCNGADTKATEIGQGQVLSCKEIFEMKGVMAARVNGSVAVVAADFVLYLSVVFP